MNSFRLLSIFSMMFRAAVASQLHVAASRKETLGTVVLLTPDPCSSLLSPWRNQRKKQNR